MTNKLIVKDLSVNYNEKKVLNNISYEFETKCYGLMGKSGSGKSTFLKSILGLIPYQGNIFLNDKLIEKDRIGFQVVFQNSFRSFDPTKTIKKSIEELEKENNTNYDLEELFEKFGMDKELLNKKSKALSGGELQRASIIRAVAQDPKVLLLDEPTASLDVINQKKVLEMINKIENTIIILVSHDLKTINYASDVKLKLGEDGKIKLIE